MTIDFPTAIEKFDAILARGLCSGIGNPDGQMCIEAAITQALDLPFSDDPVCVSRAVRQYKIRLNDSPRWVSPESRAKGLRALGIAQIGSRDVVDDVQFATKLAEKTIRALIPKLFRSLPTTNNERCLAAALRCEQEGTSAAANAADAAAYAANAANAAAEEYLLLSASLVLDVLRELKSPGCAFV